MTTAIRVLSILLLEGKKLSELKKGIELLETIEINQKIDRRKFYQNQEAIYRKLNSILKKQKLYFNVRPSGTEPILRVNLQYHKRNIKVSELKKLKNNIIKIILNAC